MQTGSASPLPEYSDLSHSSSSNIALRDGCTLFYRSWCTDQQPKRAVILFHGGHEHSGRFDELAAEFVASNAHVFAWDARGHGRSDGVRGHARHFMEWVRDADEFIRHISEHHSIPLSEMVLVGHSVGSVVAATWVHDYAPPIRGMVLGSPAFKVKLYVPLALPALRLWQKLKPNGFVRSYVRPNMLTHDTSEAESRRQDPLISPQIAIPVLTSLFDTARRVLNGAPSIQVPTMVMSAGRDLVVHTEPQYTFFDRLGSRTKQFEAFPSFFHEIFHESDRHKAFVKLHTFVKQCFSQKTDYAPFPANQATYARLSCRPTLTPENVGYAIARLVMLTFGRFSQGIRLGFTHGFDSGPMLDYVYANQARGTTWLGRTIDRIYLHNTGWRGIRQRGNNLKKLLIDEIDQLQANGKSLHIVDLAAGPGRYLQEVLNDFSGGQLSVLCRDWDERALEQGQAMSTQKGLTHIRFEKGDAFDPASISNIQPKPDIVVVSGLYELFSDNELVRRSLMAIAEVMADGGSLIVTNQPHHPQLSFIARTLRNSAGRRWVMRPRPQSEMYNLLRETGFTPGRMLSDDDGIFTVTVAYKNKSR